MLRIINLVNHKVIIPNRAKLIDISHLSAPACALHMSACGHAQAGADRCNAQADMLIN